MQRKSESLQKNITMRSPKIMPIIMVMNIAKSIERCLFTIDCSGGESGKSSVLEAN